MTTSPLVPTGRNVPLSVQIAAQLREQITGGSWPVGTRIPGEHELVDLLGASRNTVREAIRGLVHSGMLEARPGDGTYVSAASELEVALQRRAGAENIRQVFEAREALELYAAGLAAERAVPEDVDRMQRALDARDTASDVDEAIERDLEFHLEMFHASGNPLMADLYRNLDRFDAMAVPEAATPLEAHEGFIGPWLDDDPHRALLAAIRDHDPEAARAAVTRLIAHGRRLLLETRHS